MSKYLILDFKNARLFRTHDKTKDTCGYIDSICNRIDIPQFKEIITVYQVSNVIHALFEQKTVPSNRTVGYGKVDKYFNMANNSYIYINELPTIEIKNKAGETYKTYSPNQELIRTNKSKYNSWQNNPKITWNIVKNYLQEDYDWFVNEIVNKFGSESISERFEVLTQTLKECDELILNLKKKKCTALANYICDNAKANEITRDRYPLVNSNGIDICYKYDGQIIVPVNDDDIDTLRKFSSGTCTILDGGFVYINSICNDIHDIYKFRKVSEISTERITHNKKIKKNENKDIV
jgi:hypothetical protein